MKICLLINYDVNAINMTAVESVVAALEATVS